MILKTKAVDRYNVQLDDFCEILTFSSLVSYLDDKIKGMESNQQLFPRFILQRIQAIESEHGALSRNNLTAYEEIFSHIYYLTSNILTGESMYWALGTALGDEVLYGQKEFFKLLEHDKEFVPDQQQSPFYSEFIFPNKALYLLILERCYKLPTFSFKQLYRIIQDDVARYYQLKVDFSFVHVSCALDELPHIDFSCLHERDVQSFDEILPILSSIDIQNFRFEGFTIFKYIDKTNEQAGVMIQNIISKLPNLDVLTDISSFNRNKIWSELKDVMKSLMNCPEMQCSFFPLLELNGIPILTSPLSQESLFFGNLLNRTIDLCNNNEIYDYLAAPYNISYGIEQRFDSKDQLFVNYLKSLGLESYVCFPLKNKNKLVGFLELFSTHPKGIDKKDLVNVMAYLPLITNLAMDLISTFKSSMDKVILDKYTSLQESVQWKFNQEAAHYLSLISQQPKETAVLGEIKFEKVYPLYAAVDIRNSTKLRNISFRKDSYQRLSIIQLIVDQLDSIGATEEEQRFINRFSLVKSWMDEGRLDHFLLDILSFFQEEVAHFLTILDYKDPLLRKYKHDYEEENQGAFGIVNGASEKFEQTLTILNNLISTELDKFNQLVQGYFPSYFEKFRTDGIEYDMYIGQSITPTKVFDPKILKNIRKEQIISMVSIARKTFEALDQLPISLVTTQLIFVHPNPLDIVFRLDERRFDVDGGYNIRYEVIKKRIDKARLVGTKERLVQPNKIAIVYSSPRVELELRESLESIAKEHLIHSEIEHVEIEELQGIEQLKAFRVSVIL